MKIEKNISGLPCFLAVLYLTLSIISSLRGELVSTLTLLILGCVMIFIGRHFHIKNVEFKAEMEKLDTEIKDTLEMIALRREAIELKLNRPSNDERTIH